MGNAGAHNRQTQSNIYRAVHAQEFQCNVTLVVIHRHDDIELPGGGPHQRRIRRQRARQRHPFRPASLDRRSDQPNFLIAE